MSLCKAEAWIERNGGSYGSNDASHARHDASTGYQAFTKPVGGLSEEEVSTTTHILNPANIRLSTLLLW
jgi:hypothetical protein